MPIERDSSFSNQLLSTMISPVMVGSDLAPKPAIYLDSTSIRGDEVGVAVYNPVNESFDKPLRYSFQIPNDCVQINPLQLNTKVDSFTLPLICKRQDQVEFHFVFPE